MSDDQNRSENRKQYCAVRGKAKRLAKLLGQLFS